MEIKISEEEQRHLFITSWQENNVQLVCEVPVFCRSVDLVKYNQSENSVTAIEFKTHNWKRAVEQVASTAISFDYLEICIQKPAMESTCNNIMEKCKSSGIGVYFFDVNTRTFEHALLPEKVINMWQIQKSQVIDFIEKGDKGIYGK